MKFFVIIKDKSVRVPDKNFRLLGSKPMYKHLLDRLEGEEVFVNTDSKRVDGNFTIIERSQKHIDWEDNEPTSPVLSMIEEFLCEYVEDENEIIITPHVTSPFLKLATMKDAALKIGEYDSVVSCTKHNEFAYMEQDEKITPINFDPNHVKRTQDLSPIVFQNGAVEVFDGTYAEFLEKGGWKESPDKAPVGTCPDTVLDAHPKKSDRKKIKKLRTKIITERSRVLNPLIKKIEGYIR